MYKAVIIEIVASGKTKEDKALREKEKKVFEKYGIGFKAWSVEGRRVGQVFLEFGPWESREEEEAAVAKLFADKEWQDLARERTESGLLVPGTSDLFLLTDY